MLLPCSKIFMRCTKILHQISCAKTAYYIHTHTFFGGQWTFIFNHEDELPKIFQDKIQIHSTQFQTHNITRAAHFIKTQRWRKEKIKPATIAKQWNYKDQKAKKCNFPSNPMTDDNTIIIIMRDAPAFQFYSEMRFNAYFYYYYYCVFIFMWLHLHNIRF